MIGVIIGSNRQDSSTAQVGRQVAGLYLKMNVATQILDLAQLPPEIFSPTAYANKPKSFEPFAEAVMRSEGLVTITPEYNGSMPGVLKYFIDMLKFPESFIKRPVCFIGLSAGMWGGLRAVEHLQTIFGYRNAFIYPERVFLPQIHQLLDKKERITDREIVKRLKTQAVGFVNFIKCLQGAKQPSNS